MFAIEKIVHGWSCKRDIMDLLHLTMYILYSLNLVSVSAKASPRVNKSKDKYEIDKGKAAEGNYETFFCKPSF